MGLQLWDSCVGPSLSAKLIMLCNPEDTVEESQLSSTVLYLPIHFISCSKSCFLLAPLFSPAQHSLFTNIVMIRFLRLSDVLLLPSSIFRDKLLRRKNFILKSICITSIIWFEGLYQDPLSPDYKRIFVVGTFLYLQIR